jgi:hypothetical protein
MRKKSSYAAFLTAIAVADRRFGTSFCIIAIDQKDEARKLMERSRATRMIALS